MNINISEIVEKKIKQMENDNVIEKAIEEKTELVQYFLIKERALNYLK